MFGKNPIRSKVSDPDNLSVEEMFYTIQGEGPFSGVPALFIRMAGCNLACHFCDTQFETKADQTEPLPDIMLRVASFPPEQRRLVVLTGGEPLRQDVGKLVQALLESGTHVVQVETAGTLWQDSLLPFVMENRVVLVCSPKTPKINPHVAELCRHWKYVIMDEPITGADGLPGVGTQVNNQTSFQQLYRPHPRRPDDVIWVSPCDQYDADKNERNQQRAVRICLQHGYRLSLQTHKIVKLP